MYTVLYEPEACEWLRQHPTAACEIARDLEGLAVNPYPANCCHIRQQNKWEARTHGFSANRLKLRRPYPGVRAIYYVVRPLEKVVVVKIDYRDCDPYEDGR
jgi:hypothetical protein